MVVWNGERTWEREREREREREKERERKRERKREREKVNERNSARTAHYNDLMKRDNISKSCLRRSGWNLWGCTFYRRHQSCCQRKTRCARLFSIINYSIILSSIFLLFSLLTIIIIIVVIIIIIIIISSSSSNNREGRSRRGRETCASATTLVCL